MLEKCVRADENSPSDHKIQILIDAKTGYEEQFGKIIDRSARRDALFARYKEHRAKSDERDQSLKEDWFVEILIKIQKELSD